jgi:hypothetical protein
MRAEEALLDAYREWRRLTLAGARAISLRNWAFLRDSHEIIQRLQPQVVRLTREARAEWQRSGADPAAREKKLRATVAELMELGRANRALLRTALQAARCERGQLEQAGQNLKRLQQSYAITRPAAWTSFS